MSGSYRSSLFSDPGIVSAASIISRALAQDDPYKDLGNLAGAAANTELAINRRQSTQGAAQAADALPYIDTPEGRTRYSQGIVLAGADRMQASPAFILGHAAMNPNAGVEELDRLGLGARVPWAQTRTGTREHETESTRRTGISAGATIRAAQIAQDGALQRQQRAPVQPGQMIVDPVTLGYLPQPQGPSPGLDAGGNPTPGAPLPRTPYIVPQQQTVSGGATGFAPQGFMNPDGTVPTPERRGPPTTVAQVIAQQVEQSGAVGRVANGTATEGERALVVPGVAAAQVRASATREGVQARAAAIRGPGAARAQIVVDDLNRRLATTTDPAQREALLAQADAQLQQIERDSGAASPSAQAAGINARTRLEALDRQIEATLQRTNVEAGHRAALEEQRGRIRSALQTQTDDASMERLEQSGRQALDRIAGQGGVAMTLQNARLDARRQEVEARIQARTSERELDRELQAELAGARNDLQRDLREAQDDAARERAIVAADARVRAAETAAAGRASAQANRPLTRSAEEGMEAAMLRHMRDLLPGAQNNLEARAWVSERAAAYMRQTGLNSDAAARKATEDLRAAGGEGSNFFARNIIGPWGRGSLPANLPPASQLPQGAPQGQQGAPQAPQAPQQAPQAPQQAVPPPAQRVPGQTTFTNAQGQRYVWQTGPNGQAGWAQVR